MNHELRSLLRSRNIKKNNLPEFLILLPDRAKIGRDVVWWLCVVEWSWFRGDEVQAFKEGWFIQQWDSAASLPGTQSWRGWSSLGPRWWPLWQGWLGSSQNLPPSLHAGTDKETTGIFPAALGSSELGSVTGVEAQYFRLYVKLLSSTEGRC